MTFRCRNFVRAEGPLTPGGAPPMAVCGERATRFLFDEELFHDVFPYCEEHFAGHDHGTFAREVSLDEALVILVMIE